MKIAIVHEWLDSYAGSERVLEQMLKVFPSADLFCLVDFLPAELIQLLHLMYQYLQSDRLSFSFFHSS